MLFFGRNKEEKGKAEVVIDQDVVLKAKHFLECAVDYELLTTDY